MFQGVSNLRHLQAAEEREQFRVLWLFHLLNLLRVSSLTNVRKPGNPRFSFSFTSSQVRCKMSSQLGDPGSSAVVLMLPSLPFRISAMVFPAFASITIAPARSRASSRPRRHP